MTKQSPRKSPQKTKSKFLSQLFSSKQKPQEKSMKLHSKVIWKNSGSNLEKALKTTESVIDLLSCCINE